MPATRLPILTFHAIDDRQSPISFPPSLFGRAVARLNARGFHTLDLCDAVGHLRRGVPLPPRSLAITFDDGYRSVYTEAVPVLARHGMTATVFLATGERPPTSTRQRLPRLEGRMMLSWSEVREMQRAGIAFGAHTLTHPDLTRQDEAEIARQLSRSQAILQDALGAPVPCFAYPFGRHDRRCRDVARRYFACACSDDLGLASPEGDPWSLERVDAYYLRSPHWFDRMEGPLLPWYLRARNGPRRLRRVLRSVVSR